MRFDKGNCRKKRVFSQPDVSGLYEVGEIYNQTILLAPSQIYKKDFKFFLKTPIS